MENERQKHYYNCYVSGCLNSTLNSDKSFFSIPIELEKRNQWLKLMKREDLFDTTTSRARVCEAHFRPELVKTLSTRKILIRNSFPELLLPSPDDEDDDAIKKTDASVQCEYDYELQTYSQVLTPLHLSESTSRKRSILEEILTDNKRQKTSNEEKCDIQTFHKLCDKYLSNILALNIKQHTHDNVLSLGNKFNTNYKLFCWNLYYTSPEAYDLVKDTIRFPNKETLKRMYIPLTTEMNNQMGFLKSKVQNMSNMKRDCTLVIGKIRLKANLYYNIREDRIYGFHEVDGVQSPEPARYALVAMVHDLFKNYKQLVGFALLAESKHYESVSDWIDKLILELFSIGFHIRILVSDLGSDFLTARNISATNPFFFVGERKIYYMFDPPNLIKSVRDNLMTYEFHFESSVAKWQHVIQFYNKDKLKKLRIAPKLTDNHIKPRNVKKTKVKYAAQVLSATVAAGLSTYKDFSVIENSAEGTINLIQMINDLFDFLNTSLRRGRTQYQNAFCGEEYQISFVNNMLIFFASLKLIDPSNGRNVTSKVKFIEGFQITLKSLLLLFEDIRTDGFSHILTRILNQDLLEKFFDQIRTRSGKTSKPTSWQLVSAYKKVFFIDNLKSPKRLNCAYDFAKCLQDVEQLYGFLEEQDPLADAESDSALHRRKKNGHYIKIDSITSISTNDYNALDIPDNNALVYVSAYLLRKCLDLHSECKEYVIYTVGEDQSQTFEHYEEYCKDGARNLLEIPPDSFVEYVRSMEELFCICFKKSLNCEVLKSILNEVESLTFVMPCECFPLDYCRRLYIRMRIYQTLKSNNRAFRQSRNCQQTFSVTNL